MNTLISGLKWIFEKCGLEFKWLRKKQEDHKLLVSTAKSLAALQEKQTQDVKLSFRHYKTIQEDLERLTKMFIDKEIDDIRWEILDFASALSSGRQYSREQFGHVFSIYGKYEKILEEYDLNNGQVTTSMEVINDIYKTMLKNGF